MKKFTLLLVALLGFTQVFGNVEWAASLVEPTGIDLAAYSTPVPVLLDAYFSSKFRMILWSLKDNELIEALKALVAEIPKENQTQIHKKIIACTNGMIEMQANDAAWAKLSTLEKIQKIFGDAFTPFEKGYKNNSYYSQYIAKGFCGVVVIGGIVYLVDQTFGLQETKDFIVRNGQIIALASGALALGVIGSILYYGTDVTELYNAALKSADQNVIKTAMVVSGCVATVALINNTKFGTLIKKNLVEIKKYIFNQNR